MTDPVQTTKYLTPNSPSFTVHLLDGVYTAENGLIELPFHAAQELERLIATGKRPDIAQNIKKINMQAGEDVVRKHRESMGLQPAAHKGAVTHTNSPLAQAQERSHQQKLDGTIDPTQTSPSAVADPHKQKELDIAATQTTPVVTETGTPPVPEPEPVGAPVVAPTNPLSALLKK